MSQKSRGCSARRPTSAGRAGNGFVSRVIGRYLSALAAAFIVMLSAGSGQSESGGGRSGNSEMSRNPERKAWCWLNRWLFDGRFNPIWRLFERVSGYGFVFDGGVGAPLSLRRILR